MRKVLLVAILVMIPAVARAGGGGEISICPAYSSGTTILVLDSCFNGIAHSAPVGQTLTVSNEGQAPHTLTAVDGSFDTGQLLPGESASLSFEEAGIYQVFCTLHGSIDGSGMAGVLIVGEPDPAFVAAPIDPAQIQADVSEAVADGNQALAATIAGHERLLTGLVSGQAELSQKLDSFDAGAAQDLATATPIVVSVPKSEGFSWLAVTAGLASGLAIAALLAVLLSKRSLEDAPVLGMRRAGDQPIAVPDEAPTRA